MNRSILDLDDTLNRLTMPVLASLGLDVDPMGFQDYPLEAGYDIVKAANILANPHNDPSIEPWTVQTLWDSVPRSLWATVPKSDECDFILSVCEQMVGQDNILIATSPTKDPDCLAGKLEWIHTNLPKWLWRQFSITPRKHWLAKPGIMLFDDCPDNVQLFRAEGGEAVLVSRPWNS